MSIPSLDSFAPFVQEEASQEESALIARLAREAFAGAGGGGASTGLIPENGFPSLPSLSAFPTFSPFPAPPERNGLAGAFPAETRPYAPAVHPAAVGGESQLRVPETGAHCPDSLNSHPFGEPRCKATQPLPRKYNETLPRSSSLPLHLPFVGGNGGELENFYFLPRSAAPPQPDVLAWRRDFPALHQRVNGHPLVWLDNAATTHKPQSVIDAIAEFYARDNSNIHRAAHALAARATEVYEKGRETVRKFIGAADANEIIFARGTTEAINLLAQTFGRKHIHAGDEILLTEMEHHANIVPWQLLAEQTGAVIRVAPIGPQGGLRLDKFAALLNPRTKLVGVVHVANSLGTVNPVEQIVALAHAHGAKVLVDGAQSTPHMPVNVQAIDADFFTFSGHKVFGPTGIGVLYGKIELLEGLPPWQGGGNMIRDVTFEKTTFQDVPARFEAGTPNIGGVAGLTAALEYLLNIGLAPIAAYEHELLTYATAALQSVPGLRLIGTAPVKASVLSFVLDGFAPEEVGRRLDRLGIAVRAGHHCAQPSLRHFGLESTVRPSLALYNTRDEVDFLAETLRRLVQRKPGG